MFDLLRRAPVARLLLFGPALLLTACGTSASSAGPSPTPTLIPPANVGLQALIASSDLAVGANRFTFGVLSDNHPVQTPTARLEFFFVHGTSAHAMTASLARFNYFSRGLQDNAADSAAVAIGGVFVSHVRFARAGTWGVAIRIPIKGEERTVRTEFVVRQHSRTPAVGTPAPPSHNPTTAQEPATKLDSGRPPDDMHRLSIAGAIAQHRPLIVLFATAGFCTSRLCGPEIQVVEGLEHRYRGRENFVHIEIYKNANPVYGPAPTFLQWHLKTEPWVFVVNRQGIITAKFEGPTPGSEIQPAIRAALAA